MTKPNQATIFRKRQVLTAKQLTKSLGEYGSQDGVIPYNENGAADTTRGLPLGTKTNPFGSAYIDGINLYTQAEVQALVDAGKLTQTNRMLFWNLTTDTLCAWNGTEIINLQGSNDNMKYLFGDGRDGDITMVANGSYSEPKNFTSFTLNEGITLTHANTPGLLIIRCKEICKINGTINMDGKGFSPDVGYSSEIPTEWPGGLGVSAPDTAGRGATCGGGYGYVADNGGTRYGGAGNNLDYSKHLFFAQQLKFERIPMLGGGGSSNSTTVTGGSGGGGILILAPIIQFGENSVLSAKGTSGTTAETRTTQGYTVKYFWGGGGGGGGTATLVAQSIVGTPTTDFSGGASVNNCGAGGTGGMVKVILP